MTNGHTVDIPPAIKAKITCFKKAVKDYAWVGSQPPEDHQDIEENYYRSRYVLEQTIATYLEKAAKK